MDQSTMLSPSAPPQKPMSLLVVIRIVGVVLLLLLIGLSTSALGEACLGACDGVVHHLGEALFLLRLSGLGFSVLSMVLDLGGCRGVLEDLLVGTLRVLFGSGMLGDVLRFGMVGILFGVGTVGVVFGLGDRFGGALTGNGSVSRRIPLGLVGA
jgi:hypothetical protein